MHFEFEYLFAFVLLLPIICIYKCPQSAPRKYFVHLHFFAKFARYINREKLLFSLVSALIIAAIASPITYEKKSPNHRKGRDLVIILDASGSMGESGYDKEEIKERKFDSVLSILETFIKKRYDDNLGVVVFGDYAFANAPLTYDRDALNFVLKFLDVGIAGDNTAIGDGIHQGIRVLKNGTAQKKVMILISDGYQNSGIFSPKEAVNIAIKENIIIYTIGVGESKDYDEVLLKTIAKNSHGAFFQAEDAKSMKEVYEEIDSLEPSPIRSEHYLHKTLLFDIPLFIAIAILLFMLLKRQRSLQS